MYIRWLTIHAHNTIGISSQSMLTTQFFLYNASQLSLCLIQASRYVSTVAHVFVTLIGKKAVG